MSISKLVFGTLALSVAALALAAGLVSQGCSGPSTQAHSIEHLSPVYTVDKRYPSMQGPSSTQTVAFPASDPPELVWITGYRAVMVAADGETPASQEYMCHSNLDFDSRRHAEIFDLPVYHTNRLFTLSQGQFDIELPDGFGLPYYTDEAFTLTTQVLNLNPDGETKQVRHKVNIDYVYDKDLGEKPMHPLFMTSGWGLVLLEGEDGFYGVTDPDDMLGPGCLPGEAAGHDQYSDGIREFSGHWVVKPGREENRTLITEIMRVPYNTTIHYIAVHLHPFAESLELIDLTEGKSLFKSKVENAKGKIGIDRVQYFSSVEGIPVYRDHDYELVSIYNNTTDEEQDSMAVMLLYMLDKRFEKKERLPEPAIQRAHVELPVELSEERVVLNTNHGELTLALYPSAAPNHVEQFLKLAKLGVYDGIAIVRVEPDFIVQTSFPHVRNTGPLTAEQQAALRPLDAEFTDLKHRRGTVSMLLHDNKNPNSAEAAFFITLADAPFLDGEYTIIGEVVEGLDTLDRIADVPRDGAMPLERVGIDSATVVEPAPAVAQR